MRQPPRTTLPRAAARPSLRDGNPYTTGMSRRSHLRQRRSVLGRLSFIAIPSIVTDPHVSGLLVPDLPCECNAGDCENKQ